MESRSLAAPNFRRFLETNFSRTFPEWPPKSWDFDLLMYAALYYHPSLDVARAQWAVAQGGDKTAAGRPNPVLSGGPGYDLSIPGSGGPGVSPWLPSVSLDVPIETAGKRGYRMAQARHLSESARLKIITAAWQVRSNLRASLLDFTAAQKREVLLRSQLEVQDKIVHSAEQRAQVGAISTSELGLVRIARDKTRLDWLNAKRDSAAARVTVAEAIGVPARALDGVELTMSFSGEHADLSSAEVRREALLGRSDVLAALAEYAAAQSALQLEIAKQYPDVHLNPGYQYDTGDHKVTLGLSLELPILNQNQGPIAEAKARRAEAAARFEALQAKVLADIDRALSAYQTVVEQMPTLESLAAAQKKQTESAEAQEEEGETEPLDTLNARLELGVSQLAELDGRIKLQRALGALEDAMQRPVAAMKPASIEQSPRVEAMKEKQR